MGSLVCQHLRKWVSIRKMLAYYIHSKSWLRWLPESADNLEFSAERLSENAKTINSAIKV